MATHIHVPLEDRLRWAAQEHQNGMHKVFRRIWAATAVACAAAAVVIFPAAPMFAVGAALAGVGFTGASATWIGGILPTRRARKEREQAIDAAIAKGDADRAMQLHAAGKELDRFPEATRAQLYRDIELSENPVEINVTPEITDGVERAIEGAGNKALIASVHVISDAAIPVITSLGEVNGTLRAKDAVKEATRALKSLDVPSGTLAAIATLGALAQGAPEAAQFVAMHADEIAARIEAVELTAGTGTDHFLVAGSSKAFAAVAYHACLTAEQHYPGFGFGQQAAHWATRAPGIEHTIGDR